MSGSGFHCPACDYEIGGAAASSGAVTCPECGQPLEVLAIAARTIFPKPPLNIAAWIVSRWVIGWGGAAMLLLLGGVGPGTVTVWALRRSCLVFMVVAGFVSPLTQAQQLSVAHERPALRRRYYAAVLLLGWGLNVVIGATVVMVLRLSGALTSIPVW